MKKVISILVVVTFLLGLVLTQAIPASATDGCCNCQCYTPGYWKNHTDVWPSPYTTGQTLEDVFNVPDSFGLDDYTLLQALSFGGGPGDIGAAQILLRAGVAALLNTANGCLLPCGGGPGTVIYDVNSALLEGRTAMLELAEELDAFNNSTGG